MENQKKLLEERIARSNKTSLFQVIVRFNYGVYSCLLSPVSCLLSPVSYLLSPVSCLLSPVSCLLSPVSCLLSSDPRLFLSPKLSDMVMVAIQFS